MLNTLLSRSIIDILKILSRSIIDILKILSRSIIGILNICYFLGVLLIY